MHTLARAWKSGELSQGIRLVCLAILCCGQRNDTLEIMTLPYPSTKEFYDILENSILVKQLQLGDTTQ